LTVEPENAKSGKSRTVPMSAWLYETVMPLSPADGAPRSTAYPFGRPAGKPFNGWDVRKRFQRALAACHAISEEKKATVVLHTLRHTAASLMVAAGVPIFDVAKILGHSTLQVTMRYAHFAPEAGRAAIDALDRRLRPPPAAPGVVAEGAQGAGLKSRTADDAPSLRLLRGGVPCLTIRPQDLGDTGHWTGHTPVAATTRSS
jgi:hypothetical protein